MKRDTMRGTGSAALAMALMATAGWAEDAWITVPTTVVVGEHDEAILRRHTDKIASLIALAKGVILPGVSHFAMLQDPAGYTAAIRAAID